MNRSSCLCGLVLALGAGALAAQANGKPVVLRPTHQFVRPATQLGPAPRASLLERDNSDDPSWLLTGASEDSATLDLENLLSLLHGEDRDNEKLSWQVLDGGLLLSGDPAVVANCGKELDRLGAAFSRPIAVTAWLLPDGDDDLASVLEPDQLSVALQKAPAVWTQNTRTQPFGRVTLSNERWTNLVQDVDVEVAQSARIGDPKLGVLFDGLRLSCQVEPLPDGDEIVLDVNLAFGDRVEVRTQSTGDKDLPDIDLPAWHTALAQASARIRSGGALVLQMRSRELAGPSCRVLLSARFLAPPPPPVAANLLFVPVGALLHEPQAPILSALPRTPYNDGPFPKYMPSGNHGFDQDTLHTYLQCCAGEDIGVFFDAGFLLLKVDAGAQDRVSAALRQLVADRLGNFELQVETRGALAEPTAAAIPDRPKQPYQSLWRMVLPVLGTRPGSGFVGSEFKTISDFEVEIAQKSAIGNPVETVRQSGLWTAVWLQQQGQGIFADWLSQVASQGPERPRPLGGKPGGQLGLVDANLAAFPLAGDIEVDKELDLGDGPLAVVGAQRFCTRQFVKLLRR